MFAHLVALLLQVPAPSPQTTVAPTVSAVDTAADSSSGKRRKREKRPP